MSGFFKRAGTAVLVIGSLASALYALFFSTVCFGSCTESRELRWDGWLVIVASLAGSVAMLLPRARRLGRYLLGFSIIVNAVLVFNDGYTDTSAP